MPHWIIHLPIYAYYALMVCCFIASLPYLPELKMRLLAILLFVSIFVEALAEIVGVEESNHFFLYHYFNIIEYFLETWILAEILPASARGLRKWMLWSCLCYAIAAISTDIFIEKLSAYPSLSSNIESVLIMIWCLVSFRLLKPSEEIPIYRRADFWIILSFFIYFAYTFCFDSTYNALLEKGKDTAHLLFNLINSISNYILYIFLIIAIKCHRMEKKYSEQ